jgi:hypothetical protein
MTGDAAKRSAISLQATMHGTIADVDNILRLMS